MASEASHPDADAPGTVTRRRSARGVCGAGAVLRRSRRPAAAEGAGERGQRRGGADASTRILDALAARGAPLQVVRMHHDPDGDLPQRHPEPAAGREPPRDGRRRARPRRRPRRGLGRRLRPLLPVRRGRAASSTANTWWACWPRPSSSANPGPQIVHDPRVVVEHPRHRGRGGRARGAGAHRPRLLKAVMREHRRGLRRRDERASLFPRLHVLRQRHDPGAAGDRAYVGRRGAAWPIWWRRAARRFPPRARSTSAVDDAGRHRAGDGGAGGTEALRDDTDGMSASNSPTGASTCAAPTPSRCCA